MFFKPVFALYFATIALAVQSGVDSEVESDQGTSCENPWPLSTRLIIPT
jgi:hypothetical protein